MEEIVIKKGEKLQTASSIHFPKQDERKLTGSEAVIESLLVEGVEDIFGYPGGAIMPIYDALHKYSNRINHYLVRHEQGAVHAAQGYARASGKVGVAFATSGPGATNLVTGIADALMDSTPIVCVTGQVPKALLGTDAFQETDVIGITLPITKWNYQITSAEEIPWIISKAFYLAKQGRPGPVLIDITKNAQFDKVDYASKKCKKIRSYQPQSLPEDNEIEYVADVINNAKKPIILAGHGITISNGQKTFDSLLDKSGIPFASTLLGLSNASCHHPQYIGYLGMHGNYGPNIHLNESDLVIAIGMRFDDRVTGRLDSFIPNSQIVHIEIDPSEINKIMKADYPLIGDAKEVMQKIIPLLKKKDYSSWINTFRASNKIEYDKIICKDCEPKEGKLKMAEVIHMLSNKTKGDAVIITDVGQHQMVASRYFKYTTPRSNITSGGMGTMGFALPASIGAKVGAKHRNVFCIVGDGGFQMTFQELGVIMQYDIAVKVLVLNNSFLGMVRQWQQLFFEKRYSHVEMTNPNFEKIAEGFSIRYKKTETREDISKDLDDLINSPNSMILEVVVAKEENIFPMIPSGAAISEIRLE